MSQNDFTIANQTFPNTRADINSALQALTSNNSGTSAPSTQFANQFWYNSTTNILYIRNEGNDADIPIMELDQTNDTVEYFKSDSVRTALIEFTDGDDALAIADGGALTVSTSLDMNGTELFLDADADTSITADTDDTIHFKISGSDHIQFDANGITVTDSDSSQPRIVLQNTNADAGSCFLDFIKDSASPADNDNIMVLRNIGDNSAGETIAYATLLGSSSDVTDGTEDGRLSFQTYVAGTNAERMAIETGGDVTIAGGIRYNAGYGSSVAAYGCRAWIKLTGTGTIAISASANVASITDRGTGTYTVTFTTAMPDANYSTQVTTTWASGVTENVTGLVYNDAPYAQATTSVTAKTYNFTNAGAAIDSNVVMVAVFR